MKPLSSVLVVVQRVLLRDSVFPVVAVSDFFDNEASFDVGPGLRIDILRVSVAADEEYSSPDLLRSTAFGRVEVGAVTHLIDGCCLYLSRAVLVDEYELGVTVDVLVELCLVEPGGLVGVFDALEPGSLSHVWDVRPDPVVATFLVLEGHVQAPCVRDLVPALGNFFPSVVSLEGFEVELQLVVVHEELWVLFDSGD